MLLKNFRSGFVAVMGRTNVGKSTLINSILGQKITAISPRPQTTQRRQLGILSLENAQIIFIDTPGLHRPLHKLGERMVAEAEEVLEDSDVILFLVDLSSPPNEEDIRLAEKIRSLNRIQATILVLNKKDLLTEDQLSERAKSYHKLVPEADVIITSALEGSSVEQLLAKILEHLPEGPEYYPRDQITDFFERDIAADLIRAAALNHLKDEVPHGIAVRIDQYTEREDYGAYIRATVIVERESHKPIVIGKNGAMLKKIGSEARREIEAMSERKVYLDLRVKVRKDWRDDESALKMLGYRSPK
jgi:GTP-binding protein Era